MMSMVMFLAGVAAGVVLGAALGWRGLAVLAAVGIALLLATTSGIDLAALGPNSASMWPHSRTL